jgi:hypothetical protein
MAFNIKFEDEGLGKIILGSFEEKFEFNCSFWTQCDYQKDWKETAEDILGDLGYGVFFTAIQEPADSNFFRGWIAWKEDSKVIFTEKIFLEEQYDLNKLLKREYRYKAISEDIADTKSDIQVSKWTISMEEVQNFLES